MHDLTKQQEFQTHAIGDRMTKILITGATGFVGAHLVNRVLQSTDWEIISIQRLPHVKNYRLDRLKHIRSTRLRVIHHDLLSPIPDWALREIGDTRYILHAAADVHAKRSLTNPEEFIATNTMGTFNMVQAAKSLQPEKFIYTSSAEVCGPAAPGKYHCERDPITPSNPYSAAKASGEYIVNSFHKSFGVPALITRSMNLFGELQGADKFVPMVVKKIINNEKIEIHVNSKHQAGVRQWLYVGSYLDALLLLLEKGIPGEIYHAPGKELDNLEIVHRAAEILEKVAHTDDIDVAIHHPAHDLRYAIADSKMQALGWSNGENFDEVFRATVLWLNGHREWLT
jgi:dTDP-glucose 4,6-dehydratase